MTRYYTDTGQLSCDPVEDCPTRSVGWPTCGCGYALHDLQRDPGAFAGMRERVKRLNAAGAPLAERLDALNRLAALARLEPVQLNRLRELAETLRAGHSDAVKLDSTRARVYVKGSKIAADVEPDGGYWRTWADGSRDYQAPPGAETAAVPQRRGEPPISPAKVDRSTPKGAPVEFDVADYPKGYAWGAESTGETACGKIWCIERDAGIGWCLIETDAGEYRHVPMDRVRVIETNADSTPDLLDPDGSGYVAEPPWSDSNPRDRLEYLRGELRAERISMGELADLQGLAGHIEPGDVELLEAAGVPEHSDDSATLLELRAQLPEWKLEDVPDDATVADLREILAEIDADDPPLLEV